MNVEELVDRVTIHGRVALVLCIGEPFFNLLTKDPDYGTTQKAFSQAVRWLAGESVTGDAVSDLLHNEADEKVLAYDREARDPSTRNAYVYVQGTLCYVAWHIYNKTGEYPGELTAGLSEEAIFYLLDSARDVPTYDEAYAERAYNYILSNYRIEGEDELGKPIDLEDVRQHVRR